MDIVMDKTVEDVLNMLAMELQGYLNEMQDADSVGAKKFYRKLYLESAHFLQKSGLKVSSKDYIVKVEL